MRDKNKKIILSKKKISEHQIEDQTVDADGDYAFCFVNAYTYTTETVINFDYDGHLDSETVEGRLDIQLKAEKRQFMINTFQKLTPKITGEISKGLKPRTAEEMILDAMRENNEDRMDKTTIKEVLVSN